MAELTFIGAAGTVTGSKHLLRTAAGSAILIDCGLFQGQNADALNAVPLPIAPSALDAVVITHGHIDHVGYLPKLVHDGFHGPIYCTPPTAGVIAIVLADAAHLQAHLSARGFQHEKAAPPPFYDADDVAATLELLRPVELETDFAVAGAQARFHNAGHILGSAFADLTLEGKRILFTGDIGRYDRPLLYDPERVPSADVIVMEATYGNRLHPPQPLDDLHRVLQTALALGGPIIIPAFAVERTQEILYAIGQLQQQDDKIAALAVHLDSPMAIKVDELFARFASAHRPLPQTDGAPFGCRNLQIHVTAEESKAINAIETSAIIIASSGMAAGGRVMHHLHRCLPNPLATVVFVGFQGPGTHGAALLGGQKSARIYGDVVPVHAAIVDLPGYSAHADQAELLRWLGGFTNKPRTYLVHGEAAAANVFAALAHERLGFATLVAARGTSVTV